MTKQLNPVTPGEIILYEFLEPLEMTQNELADALHISLSQIEEIINGKKAITPEIALRLSRYFATSPEFWLNLQQRYDLKMTQRLLGAEIEKTVQPRNALFV
ncbi:MAG: HigA family addiction module antidote protein [Gomphosphaeria aponina SAG 52.96 = DSM 107014]|uniref:HigA family addiction module antidote protein n=1 Tax=Gomphosphaeria aponina SAG 52.96 = DSM 107014 TaxID=1521640 RepID=A0A941GWM3_9CHRO|nr:HigA family addiction module antidote protein [Gomphosphaeria aponina SAG 52.96 = DSM 107014]